jgi:hypothetical protein
MQQRTRSKLVFAGLLLGADAVQAAGPTSVSEAPAAWYADRIVTSDTARGAAAPVIPAAAYEHGTTVNSQVDAPRTRPGIAGMTLPFPSSPNESGAVL